MAALGVVERVCLVCARENAQYRCPRCNLVYCSATCYKVRGNYGCVPKAHRCKKVARVQDHGLDCTEAFAAQHVADNLGLDVRLEGTKQQAIAALQADTTAKQREEETALANNGDPYGERPDGDDTTLDDEALLEAALLDLDTEVDGAAVPDMSENSSDGSEFETPAPESCSSERLEQLHSLAASSASGAAGGISLADLTAEERRAFLRAVARGDLSETLARWRPWWTVSHSERCTDGPRPHHASEAIAASLISVVPDAPIAVASTPRPSDGHTHALLPPCIFACPMYSPSTSDGSGGVSSPPWPLRPPPLLQLVRQAPPEQPLASNLPNLLCAYAHLQRLYCGDWGDEAPRALAAALLELSAVLASDARFGSPAEAADAVLAAAQAPQLRLTAAPDLAAGLLPLRDALQLVGGGGAPGGDGRGGATASSSGGMALPPVGSAPSAVPGPFSAETDDGPAAGSRHYVVDALLHLQWLLLQAATAAAPAAAAVGPKQTAAGGGGRESRRLHAAAHKARFFAAWAWDGGDGLSDGGLVVLRRQLAEHLRAHEEHQKRIAPPRAGGAAKVAF